MAVSGIGKTHLPEHPRPICCSNYARWHVLGRNRTRSCHEAFTNLALKLLNTIAAADRILRKPSLKED
ncbi:hypothetical protein NKI01_25015 [Mesorhizobium sp. M0815]|uniref:hypothetical protein n=1 Tax=Mesorhizobium sp. M0815 TaxID=2957005 RepID=UPI00333C8F74